MIYSGKEAELVLCNPSWYYAIPCGKAVHYSRSCSKLAIKWGQTKDRDPSPRVDPILSTEPGAKEKSYWDEDEEGRIGINATQDSLE